MRTRYLVGGLAVILAIAVAVPALGVDAGSSASVKKVSKNLKKLTKRVAALEETDPVPGPQGPQGPQGEQGQQGQQGATGPSEATSSSTTAQPMNDGSFATLVDVPTPAGSYVFWGKVDMSGATTDQVQCRLRTNQPPVNEQDLAIVDGGNTDGNTLALLATATTTGSDVNLDCMDGAAGSVIADNVRLVAMRVGSLVEE
jgi:hypothetical protein